MAARRCDGRVMAARHGDRGVRTAAGALVRAAYFRASCAFGEPGGGMGFFCASIPGGILNMPPHLAALLLDLQQHLDRGAPLPRERQPTRRVALDKAPQDHGRHRRICDAWSFLPMRAGIGAEQQNPLRDREVCGDALWSSRNVHEAQITAAPSI
jgi:hypothetical protein